MALHLTSIDIFWRLFSTFVAATVIGNDAKACKGMLAGATANLTADFRSLLKRLIWASLKRHYS